MLLTWNDSIASTLYVLSCLRYGVSDRCHANLTVLVKDDHMITTGAAARGIMIEN